VIRDPCELLSFNLANGPLSWVSRKQRVITLVSDESEYINLSKASREATFLSRIMKEITGKDSPVMFHNDSQSAQALARDPVQHIDVKCILLENSFRQGVIVLKYLKTHEMLEVVLTKLLPKGKIEFYIDDIGTRDS